MPPRRLREFTVVTCTTTSALTRISKPLPSLGVRSAICAASEYIMTSGNSVLLFRRLGESSYFSYNVQNLIFWEVIQHVFLILRWAHKQARQRELDEAIDFFA